MPGARKTVKEYLAELEGSKKEKPAQVKEAIEIYVDLWRKAIEKGVVTPADEIGEALLKVDADGGLYRAAES